MTELLCCVAFILVDLMIIAKPDGIWQLTQLPFGHYSGPGKPDRSRMIHTIKMAGFCFLAIGVLKLLEYLIC